MPDPVSLPNTTGQRIDTIYFPDGTQAVKVAVGGQQTVGSLTPKGGAQQVGSHAATGATLGSTDPVTALAGVYDLALDGPTGDAVKPVLVDSLGRLLLGGATDDGAFAILEHRLILPGYVADETSTDSVDEGDVGYARMTLNRRQLMASHVLDDGAFGIATEYVGMAGFLADETSPDSVDEGDAGAARMTLDRKQIIARYAHAAGGATPYKLISAATTNATSVKASPGTLYNIHCNNLNAARRYLKLYNKASAPTVGTDVPVMTLELPIGGVLNMPFDAGLNFSAGIALAITSGIADSDTGVVSASEHVVNLAYA